MLVVDMEVLDRLSFMAQELGSEKGQVEDYRNEELSML